MVGGVGYNRGVSSLCISFIVTLYSGSSCALNAKEHYDAGGAKLLTGDFTGALDHYHSACDQDPKDFMNFYKRATVYLATSRSKKAAQDLATVLGLKPGFSQARTRLADIRLKQGSYADAKADYTKLGAEKYAAELMKVQTGEEQSKRGQQLLEAKDFAAAIDLLSQAIEISPTSEPLRRMRAECYMATGQNGEAIGDVTRATKLKPNNVEAYFLLSQLQFTIGDRANAISNIRECVKLDGDHKPAFAFYKMLKKFNKAADKVHEANNQQRWGDVVEGIAKMRKAMHTNLMDTNLMDSDNAFYTLETQVQLCQCHMRLKAVDEAKAACKIALELDPKNIEAIIVNAEIFEHEQDYEACIKEIQDGIEIDGENQRLKEKLQRYQKMLKQSLKRDYYKILGLPRDCNKKQIVKAYRSMAQEWHPDKFSGEEEKKTAEKKFMDIADAKEVLTDPQMRQIFDDGEDPLDAEQNQQRQQHGHNPFHGGNPFGGGGGQRFHFRHG